mgnify:CR=1 FL=1
MPTAVLRMCYRKKHKGCKKKTVRKQWLEDLVVNQTMQLVKDDAAMESIIAKVMELQDRENTSLPLYEKQLRDAESGIQNMLNAIQAGILTSSTKERLEQLEETKREFEARIAEEKLAKPKIKEEFIRFWLMRFRKLDMSLKDQRQALVDTFINSIYLYDDKVLIAFNYKEGTQTITFEEAAQAASKENGSDLDCFTAVEQAAADERRAAVLGVIADGGRVHVDDGMVQVTQNDRCGVLVDDTFEIGVQVFHGESPFILCSGPAHRTALRSAGLSA